MNCQSAFKTLGLKVFGHKNTLVAPVALIEFLDGDVSAAMHLSQIFYWSGKTKSGVFYKRYDEWKNELYQPINKLRANVAKFIEMDIIETKVKRVRHLDNNGNPTRFYGDKAVFYKVNWEKFEEMFLEYANKQYDSQGETPDAASGKRPMQLRGGEFPKSPERFSEVPPETLETPPRDFPYITETTTENTNKEKLSMSEPKSSDQDTEVLLFSREGKQVNQLLEENNKQFLRRKKNQPSPFDIKAASKFAEVVKSHRKVQRNSDLRKWADTFRQMREVDKVPEEDIREAITWYRKYIGDDFIPEAFSAAAFRKKYAEGKFTSAMKRSKNGASSSNGRNRLTRENMWNDPENVLSGGILKVEVGQDGREYDGQLLYRIRKQILERFGRGLPLPEELQIVLDEEFPEVENMPLSIIGRVG